MQKRTSLLRQLAGVQMITATGLGLVGVMCDSVQTVPGFKDNLDFVGWDGRRADIFGEPFNCK